ncbi:DUF6597 domain-containing transcriptional factor [Oxalobacteraceae bacterium A2-2]
MSTLQPVTERPKGVVHPAAARQAFRLARYLPEPDLAPFLDHFWVVEWHFPAGASHDQRVLPYPCVNLAFDPARTGVFGVVTGAFDYHLEGSSRVLGVRFRPGGFRPVLRRPLNTITDRIEALAPIFGIDDREAERQVLSGADDAAMVEAASAILRRVLPAPDPEVERINAVLALLDDMAVTRVQQWAERAGMGVRTLQLLFQDYVGVSPKWAICRKRLHEAADQLASGAELDLSELAQRLGYYDQAHFTSDFEKLVGQPPAEYRRSCTRSA